MNQQDLVWVRLPFSSLGESKVRPAVVVSHDHYNRTRDDVIACAVTSKIQEDPYGIVITSKNLSQGRLPVTSRIRADKILQIGKSLILQPFARLDNRTFDAAVNKITALIQRQGN